ncbi:MAG: CCA tRNA nucleotidyltransferase [Candidatus Methylomirabilales bacterium]
MRKDFPPLPPSLASLVRRVGEVAEAVGVQVYAVGGFVRDLCLGYPSTDLDLVVEGAGIAFARHLAKALGATCTVHARFRTATLAPGPRAPGRLDVATARREWYPSPAALPRVEPGTLVEDLFRRDFTVNAMAIAVGREGLGALEDPYGGLSDLKAGLLRVLHPRSYCDDPTRILRGARFASRFRFRLSRTDRRLIRAAVAAGALDALSPDRLRGEMFRLLSEPRAGVALRLLQDLGCLEALVHGWELPPGLFRTFRSLQAAIARYRGYRGDETINGDRLHLMLLLEGQRSEIKRAILGRLGIPAGIQERLARDEQGAAGVGRALAKGKVRQSRVRDLLDRISPEARIWLWARGKGRISRLVCAYVRSLSQIEPVVSARDLMGLGVPAGPAIGRLLGELKRAKVDGRLRSQADEWTWVRERLRRHPLTTGDPSGRVPKRRKKRGT